ncbi:helix-turn-helix domain-containing protein [Actinophytocola sediminis]
MTPPVTPTRTSHSDLPVLYTTDEAADILRVRKSWLERQAAARKVPFTLLGGSYRFSVAHLHEIVHIFEPDPSTVVISTPRIAMRRGTQPTGKKATPLQARHRTRAA